MRPTEVVPDPRELISAISDSFQIAEDKDGFLGLPQPVIRAFSGIVVPAAAAR